MKIAYHGYAKGHRVTVESMYEVTPLRHHVRHSPDGFCWGYGGSGPAELARCLLMDFLGTEPKEYLYQDFKSQVIANLPMDQNWTLTYDQVQEWFNNQEAPF